MINFNTPLFCLALITLVITSGTVNGDDRDTKSYSVLSAVGIGMRKDHGDLFVSVVVADSPADKSGRIQKGDRLVAVETDDRKTLLSGKSVGEAASLIRGPSGTTLVRTLVPDNADSEIEVTLTRAPLALDGVSDASYRSFVGTPTPEMELRALDGNTTTKLSDYRGEIVVLDFWAPWCATCYAPVTKMQEIVKRHDVWSGIVEMISVSVDSDHAQAAKVVEKQGWNRTRNLEIKFDKLMDIGGRSSKGVGVLVIVHLVVQPRA